jgi:outer membrane protein OmpA-like peptidoglycan-associated protein
MKPNSGKYRLLIKWSAVCVCLLPALTFVSAAAGQFNSGHKSKVKGTIVSRGGDLIKIQDKKSGSVEVLKVTDNTKIQRDKGKFEFYRHSDMDVTALVPGLTLEAEGVGNAQGQLEVAKLSFSPDVFAIEVAEEQQILGNKASAAQAQNSANQAQTSADQAQSSASQAQSSAYQAQSSANQAGVAAQAAGEIGVIDAADVQKVNQRVSELGDYKTVAEAGVYFPTDGSRLDDAAKADLDTLAAAISGANGYLIEIAGYASSTGTPKQNQVLSEDRAAAVAQYLRDKDNVPMRRIVAPAGYGASHPAADNSDAQGRALNRRVDVKVLINQGLVEGT